LGFALRDNAARHGRPRSHGRMGRVPFNQVIAAGKLLPHRFETLIDPVLGMR
jgi:hypothetical protein